ncbi:CDP-6-deoxy-delta-3,4-glucoseen reductase [Variovorax sp. YR216]|uniref:CDP-6-deoxy-delta-3,4-glucoseen reductase n=1 Tax=Variovorax sp. YR216 TaxID=1882828 RepID=UPI00089CCFE6|nr:CDP-6-deoxy-delta-3,4-glucoseen reductase [Variovorax sp. YR216]SEB25751.1 CDP-4-dehydro-6-deoxyglucose reductase [Variovorax sp. YR216]
MAAGPFRITAQPSGRTFGAQGGEAILAAAIRQGVGMPYGCRDGACGSCKCRMLEGAVNHGPHQSQALSAQEEADGLILPCCAVPATDVVLESPHITDEGAFPVRKMAARVIALERKASDVTLMKIRLPANDPLRYRAGQYIDIILRDGFRRSYSMANAPHDGAELELHIRHMPGGRFTDHVFGAMKEKDILRVEGPFGSFYLREDSDKPLILLASGTGLAPIKALIEHMQRQGIRRQATLYWGGRRLADLYLDGWVRERLADMPQLRYVPVISDALAEDLWTGRTGFVHRAVMQDYPDLSGHQVYACGAPVVINAARAEYSTRCKLPANAFFADSFITQADSH